MGNGKDHRAFCMLRNGARFVQRCWRGYAVRKDNPKRYKQMRERVALANARRTKENSVKSRSDAALTVLLSSKRLEAVTKACTCLEFATRYSESVCKHFLDRNAIDAIYNLISSCNRGAPHCNVVSIALKILINICNWSKLMPGVCNASEEQIKSLVDRLQRFYSKSQLSHPTVRILRLIFSKDEKKELIKGTKIFSRMTSISRLLSKNRRHGNQADKRRHTQTVANLDKLLKVLQ